MDGRSRVEKFISSTNDLFLIKQVNYINKDKRPSKGTLFVKTRNESERRKWMNAVASVIKEKSNDASGGTDATSHRIEISAKDAEAFEKFEERRSIIMDSTTRFKNHSKLMVARKDRIERVGYRKVHVRVCGVTRCGQAK